MATIIDSYSESNANTVISFDLVAGGNNSIGQSFTGDGNTLGSVKWFLNKTGSPTGTLTSYIYAHTGTFGVNGVPTGAALATSSTVDVSTLTTTLTLYDFTFSGANQITLTNGTNYCVVITISGGSSDASNRPSSGRDSTSPTHAGIISRNIAGTWAVISGNDAPFYVYSTASAYSLTATQQSYTLTGVAPSITSARTMATTQASFTLTGIAAAFARTINYVMSVVVGSFSLTGNAAQLLFKGWTRLTKSASTFANIAKNSAPWSNSSKNSAFFSNLSKSSSSWANQSKNASSFTNQSKS